MTEADMERVTFEEACANGNRWRFGYHEYDDVFSVPEVISKSMSLHWRNTSQIDNPHGWFVRNKKDRGILAVFYICDLDQYDLTHERKFMLIDAGTNEPVCILEPKWQEDGLDDETPHQFVARCFRLCKAAAELQYGNDILMEPGLEFSADKDESRTHLDMGLAAVKNGTFHDSYHPDQPWNAYAKERAKHASPA